MKSNKIVIVILLVIFAAAGTGAYYLYSKTQQQVVEYTVLLGKAIFDNVSDRNDSLDDLVASLTDTNGSINMDDVSALFNKEVFQAQILTGLREIDKMDEVLDFKYWDVVVNSPSIYFKNLWGHLIRVVMIRKEKGLDPYKIDQDLFKYLNSSFESVVN